MSCLTPTEVDGIEKIFDKLNAEDKKNVKRILYGKELE